MTPLALVQVGKAAQSLALLASDRRTIRLADFKGKKTVVLYFYPRADTPGCTKQACGFRDALAEYDKAQHRRAGHQP